MDTVAEIQDIINPSLKVIGVIATFFEKGVTDDNDVLALLQKEYHVIGVTKEAVDTRKGIYDGRSIVEKFPDNGVAHEYVNIASKIISGQV